MADSPPYELIIVLARLFEAELELPPVTVQGDLAPQPRVFIYNQKWNIPPIPGLFVEVGFLGSKVYASGLAYENDPVTGALVQVQTSNVQEIYTVTAFSENQEAIQRHHELPMALRSYTCQSLCEQYCFKVGYVPTSAVDASTTETTAYLSKYVYTFRVLRSFQKTKAAPYYDQFQNPPQFLITNP